MNPSGLVFLLVGAIFILAGAVQYKYPPKKINAFYGYRTARSMRDHTIWKYAQRYSAVKMMQLGGWLCALGALAWVVDFRSSWGLWVALGTVTVFPLLMLLQIEGELKKRFPDKS